MKLASILLILAGLLLAGAALFRSVPLPSASPAGAARGPFIDYRDEKPGNVRKITLQDLPEPYATKSAGNGPNIVPRPANAWPQVLPGFKVEQYATGLKNPRLIRTAPICMAR